ncbi:hypothetical protein QTP86_007004, partial [Hemibagrus guttatus]
MSYGLGFSEVNHAVSVKWLVINENGEKPCGYEIGGKNTTNLKRHLKAHHPAIYAASVTKLRQALGGQVVLPDDWETTAEVIRETERKVLGVSSGWRKEDKKTWWWNEELQDSVQRKRLAKKKWDMDRTEENRQEYKELQRRVKREVSKAKQKAYDELYTRLDTREGQKDLYRLSRQRDRDGKDVQQVGVIKDRDRRVLTSEESVQRRWKEYFEELMNEENEREKRVEGVNSVEQKVDKIRKDEVRKALKRMKSGKAVGPDDIPVEVWKCLGEAAVEFLTSLFNRVLESERMPEEWRRMMDQLSEEVRQQSSWTMMFADDIVVCSESREQVEENLERWRFALERRGMKVSRSKTEYMCVNEREGSGTVRLQGEEVKKVQEFKYLGSTVQSNGECGKEVKKRVQAGWNGWRKVSEVLCDKKISARIKGKVYRIVVRAAMLYGLEKVSMRKRQESELEVAELKMLRDQVMLLVTNMACKLLAKWQDPYMVLEKVGPVNYRLQQPNPQEGTLVKNVEDLSPIQIQDLAELVNQFANVVSSAFRLTKLVQHEIKIPPWMVVWQCPEACCHTVEMEVERISSPWTSPIVVVPKPDRTLQLGA